MTREEAIYRLNNTAWLGSDADRVATGNAVQMAIEALSDVPDTNVVKWIPCSERLPVKIGNYLVTTSRGGVWAKRWDRGWCGNTNNNNIKAWMPLPTPYKGDES